MKWDVIKYDGRIGRLKLVSIIGFCTFAWYVIVRSLIPGVEAGEITSLMSMGFFTISLYWVMICSYIKRLHDTNRPGIQLLLMLVPFVNLYLYWLLLFEEGTKGPNNYGLPEGDGSGAIALLDKGKAAEG